MSAKGLWQKEDNLAILIAFVLVFVVNLGHFAGLDFISFLNFKITTYSNFNELLAGLNLLNFILFYALFASVFAFVAWIYGRGLRKFIFEFSAFFILCVLVLVFCAYAGFKSWADGALMALLVGLFLANFTPLKLANATQTELYIKIGVILMGVCLPLNSFLQAANIAIIQACTVTIITFLAIFLIAVRIFRLDKKFAATLAAGGSICGVSAAIVVGEACRAKKEHISASISIVVFFATLMIVILPIFCKALELDAGVAGAFIGTSEFADAAGFAAVASLNDERANLAFLVMKVIGRDTFIGVWAVLLAFISLKFWDKNENEKISALMIWQKFPKFILGFLFACLFTSFISFNLELQNLSEYEKQVLGCFKNLKNWFFTLAFLSIGFSVRFKDILSVGFKPFLAFFFGSLINLIVGFVLCVFVFDEFWSDFLKG